MNITSSILYAKAIVHGTVNFLEYYISFRRDITIRPEWAEIL
jgi:hypothetical protein